MNECLRFGLSLNRSYALVAQMKALKETGIDEIVTRLGLRSSHTMSNTHAFDGQGKLRHFKSPREVIELHAEHRLAGMQSCAYFSFAAVVRLKLLCAVFPLTHP